MSFECEHTQGVDLVAQNKSVEFWLTVACNEQNFSVEQDAWYNCSKARRQIKRASKLSILWVASAI